MRKILKYLQSWWTPIKDSFRPEKKVSLSMPPELWKPLQQLIARSFKMASRPSGSIEPIKSQWNGLMDSYKSATQSESLKAKSHCEGKIKELSGQLGSRSEKQHLSDTESLYKASITKELLEVERKNGEFTETLNLLDERRRELAARLHDMVNEGRIYPARISSMDTRKVLVLVFVTMMVVEGFFTYLALEELDLVPTIGILLFISLYGGLVGLTCHLAGHYYSVKERRSMGLSILGTFLLTTVIVLLRAYGSHHVFDWVLNAVNYALIYAGIVVSIRMHRYRLYWDTTKALEECVAQIDALNAKLAQYPLSRLVVTEKYDGQVLKEVQKERQNLEHQIGSLQTELNGHINDLEYLSKRAEAYRLEGLNAIQEAFETGRN